MTAEQLELMIRRTGAERLRFATSDANPDAKERESTRRWVEEAAAFDEWPPPRPASQPEPVAPRPHATHAELRRATKLGSSKCWFSVKDSACGCNGLWCDLLKRRINVYDCVSCLKRL